MWAGRKKAEPRERVTGLEDRLRPLSRLMSQSAQLTEQVSAEMDLRRAEVQRLQQEQHDAQIAKSLTDEQLAMLESRLAAVMRPETNRGIKWAVITGALSFIAGVAATIAVTILVHP